MVTMIEFAACIHNRNNTSTKFKATKGENSLMAEGIELWNIVIKWKKIL